MSTQRVATYCYQCVAGPDLLTVKALLEGKTSSVTIIGECDARVLLTIGEKDENTRAEEMYAEDKLAVEAEFDLSSFLRRVELVGLK